MWSGSKPEEPAQPEHVHYFRIEVSPYMRDRLKSVLGKQTDDQTNRALREAVELAERVNLPFTPPVDWDALERRARDQGYSVADQIFDGPAKPKPAPKPQIDPPGGMGT